MVSVWEAARKISEPYSISNMIMEKFDPEFDDVEVTLSTAVNCRSMGSATCWAICSEDAPGFVAVTATVGNSTGGISSRRSMLREISPSTMMTRVTKAMKARFYMLSLTSQSTMALCAEMCQERFYHPPLDRLGAFNLLARQAMYGRPNIT